MSLISADKLNGEDATIPTTLAEGSEATACRCGCPIWLELKHEAKLLCWECSPDSIVGLCERSWHVLVAPADCWEVRDLSSGEVLGRTEQFTSADLADEKETEPTSTRSHGMGGLDPLTFIFGAYTDRKIWGLAREGDGGKAWQKRCEI